jgi:peptidase M28-like protein
MIFDFTQGKNNFMEISHSCFMHQTNKQMDFARTKQIVLTVILLFPLFLFSQQEKYNFSADSVLSRLKTDVAFLASDELRGRESGSADEILAANYIIKEFKKAGLSPFNGESYLQSFVYFEKFKAKKLKIEWGEESILDNQNCFITHFTSSGKLEGECILVKDGNNLPDGISGKIVILNLESDDLETGVLTKDLYRFSDLIHKIEKQGAKAIVLRKNFEENYHPYFYQYRYPTDTTAIPVIYNYTCLDDSLFENRQDDMTIDVQVERSKADTAFNIIGLIDNGAKNTVLIGGHYDHIGLGYWGSRDKNWAGEPHNGADDNASGTAAVIELARFLKAKGTKNYNYAFVAFSAEERGLYGSKYLCNSDLFEELNINYMINFDMIGRMRKARNKIMIMGVGTASAFKPVLKKAPYQGRISMFNSSWEGSDHWPFYKRKIPFIYFSTGLHADYHQISDDTYKINFKGILKTIQLSEYTILKLDKMPKLSFHKPKKDFFLKYLGVFTP